jgi:hypothetical protein
MAELVEFRPERLDLVRGEDALAPRLGARSLDQRRRVGVHQPLP